MLNAETFLNQIHQEPESDEPRLIYADWLSERGDPRGEFIHLQCQLEQLADEHPAVPALVRRESELLQLHRDEWGPAGQQVTFQRGFVDQVAGQQAANKQRFEAMQREHPITHLVNWAGRPHLRGIRRLTFTDERAYARFQWHAQGDPSLAETLRELDIARVDLQYELFGITHSYVRELVYAKWLPRLERLAISAPMNWSTHRRRFFRWLAADAELELHRPHPTWVHEIGDRRLALFGFSASDVDRRQWRRFIQRVDAAGCPRLHALGCVEVGAAWFIEMLHAAWTRELTDLTIRPSVWSEPAQRSVARVEELGRLHRCGLMMDDAGHPLKVDLAEWELRALRRLNIRCPARDPGPYPLERFLQDPPPTLRRLDLSYTRMTDDEWERLAQLPGVRQLTHLNLANNRLTDRSIETLLADGPWETLAVLNLSHNSITSKGRERLVEREPVWRTLLRRWKL